GRKHYATTNAGEYWAEGAQWWFYSNYGECFAGNIKVESPEEFKAYDPRLFELLSRVFDTHRIPMDVFHAKRIRPVTCPGVQEARSVAADSTWTRTATGLSFRVLEPGTGEPARN